MKNHQLARHYQAKLDVENRRRQRRAARMAAETSIVVEPGEIPQDYFASNDDVINYRSVRSGDREVAPAFG